MSRFIKYALIVFVLVLPEFVLSAQSEPENKVRFAYDVSFDMDFDNREYYRSDFSPSMTIFGARLSPSVGISVLRHDDLKHKVMLGVDVMKDFGGGTTTKDIIRELLVYYKMTKPFRNTDFSMTAGIFSKNEMEGFYSRAFFSDSLRFYDNNIEGLLLKFRQPGSYFEVGCDWIGQYSTYEREKFMIFSSGVGKILPFMSLGYSAYMYHFANSEIAKGLVDNILVNPYISFDFGYKLGIQKAYARVGWLQAMQNDRRYVGEYVFPGGGELDMELRNWNVGIANSIYYGADIMPYYDSIDSAGIKYGNNLYYGDPFYRVHNNKGNSDPGFYDRLEAYYEPKIGTYLKLRISAVFHFNDIAYSGCQQMVTLKFDLQELINRYN